MATPVTDKYPITALTVKRNSNLSYTVINIIAETQRVMADDKK
ncbi:hypothetical protein [Methylomonas albis]|nr:hypothetical protein [Methylomonas albis]